MSILHTLHVRGEKGPGITGVLDTMAYGGPKLDIVIGQPDMVCEDLTYPLFNIRMAAYRAIAHGQIPPLLLRHFEKPET